MASTLYLVATPIGNLEDITLRALRILREEIDLIACEDTRQTRKLLDHYGIRCPVISYHEHNENIRAKEILERLRTGASVALVSDAGTPLISDPGYRIVKAAIEAGINVVPIPGSCAVMAALVASGLPTDAFQFAGFLPAKRTQRLKTLQGLKDLQATTVFFEAPHRIVETLEDIGQVLGQRAVVVAREITKIHEEFLRGTPAQIHSQLSARPAPRGEFTLLVGRATEPAGEGSGSHAEAVRALMELGMARMDAIKQVARQRGLPKREVYRLLEESG
jgi:16S rRNA (cytidine1402-2'-O)-methyltransferase